MIEQIMWANHAHTTHLDMLPLATLVMMDASVIRDFKLKLKYSHIIN